MKIIRKFSKLVAPISRFFMNLAETFKAPKRLIRESVTLPVWSEGTNKESYLKKLIEAGEYDETMPDMEHLRFRDPDQCTVVGKGHRLFWFGDISTDEAIKRIKVKGYSPATFADLLYFGTKKPEEARDRRIIALGSIAQYRGNRFATFLEVKDGKCRLSYDHAWLGLHYASSSCFLAVET